MPPLTSSLTSLTVTNPLILYRTLLAQKKIDPDPAQHRLALELQNVYHRLKDYSPEDEYGARLKSIRKTVADSSLESKEDKVLVVPSHPLRRNPLFSHLLPKTGNQDALALTTILTNHEAAMELNSPKGLLLHGEVGTGKSMLLDLLADSLPNPKKRRYHFNTFMLETLSRLEHLRLSRTGGDAEYSMIWLAKEMIEKSPILFLDEFQLPDRAASKILSNLFIPFFQLGGVLIASSNRMPDELAKASGMDFSASAKGGTVRKWLGLVGGSSRSQFQANNEYGQFVDVLKARCDIWDMNGGRDWRRREAKQIDSEAVELINKPREDTVSGWTRLDQQTTVISENELPQEVPSNLISLPKRYLLSSIDSESWHRTIHSVFPLEVTTSIPWEQTRIQVYGRTVEILKHLDGVTCWTFSALCGGAYGPADYITLASTFHTLILEEVPTLTVLQKNEARRFITLLDALYEARCKLVVQAEAGPDDIFFPESAGAQPLNGVALAENDGGDAVYPETLSEIYQDQISPFRPNISSYIEQSRSGYDPDEDSDSNPLEKGSETGHGVDFGNTGIFTGEDERFAYKRARSRLWEMCGARWHARSELGWWRPLPLDVRKWEQSSTTSTTDKKIESLIKGDVKLGDSVKLDKLAGLQGGEIRGAEQSHVSPFRENPQTPPKIGWAHAWGMMKWGKKAGAWGQGPDGSDKRNGTKK